MPFVNGIGECDDCKSRYRTSMGFCKKRSCIVFNLHRRELRGIRNPARMIEFTDAGNEPECL